MKKGLRVSTILTLSLFLIRSPLSAQGVLDKPMSISVRQKPLTQTLTEISKKGGFIFSYNTSILNGDSLITLTLEKTPLKTILEKLLGDGFDFAESGHYVIILQKTAPPGIKIFTISGYVKDEDTREKVSNVSVYENEQLVSALTDTNGYFKLRLRDKYAHATLVISKQMYADTFVVLRSGVDQQLDLNISHAKITELPAFVVTSRVEKTWFARFFLSRRLIIQSKNIIDFLAKKQIQLSLTPRLGTHGTMSGQIVNKASFNILGGYTAGVNGLELGGIFNIDKNDAKYVQGAGILNVVGGKVRGVQMAGIHNDALDSVWGVQMAGVSNRVKGSVIGVQMAGVVNVAQDVRGVQASGIVNHTRHLHGVQLGVVNIADTCDGVQIGILNFVKHGIHQLTLSADEIFPFNVAYKVGSQHTYSILEVSLDPTTNQQAWAWGFGIGQIFKLNRRCAVVFELSQRQVYLGHWNDMPYIDRLQATLQVSLSKSISLYAGPAVSYYHIGELKPAPGYKSNFPGTSYQPFAADQHNAAWVGWSVGINFF